MDHIECTFLIEKYLSWIISYLTILFEVNIQYS